MVLERALRLEPKNDVADAATPPLDVAVAVNVAVDARAWLVIRARSRSRSRSKWGVGHDPICNLLAGQGGGNTSDRGGLGIAYHGVRAALVPGILLAGCGSSVSPGGSEGGTTAAAEDDEGEGESRDDDDSDDDGTTSGPGGSEAEASSDGPIDTTTGLGTTSEDPTDASDTAGGTGPTELYRGPVVGGSIPGWDPDAPRPLVMLGRDADDWVATLARIGPDGALSDNVTEEIIVWGFAADPPLLYEGPVADGSIDGWDPASPSPMVMMGRQGVDWVATLATIEPDGAIGDNFAEEIKVWGWTGVEPSAPTLRYEGPVAGGTLDGWDASAPEPLVVLGTPGFDLWVTTLVRIADDGALSDNVAMSLRAWGWP